MKKSIIVIVLVLSTCLLFSGCSQDNNSDIFIDSSRKEIIPPHDDRDMPTLSIEYKDTVINAVMGTYSWNITGKNGTGIESDSGSIEELVTYQEQQLIINEDSEILFNFSVEPIKYTVEIWDVNDYELSSQVNINDNKLIVTKDQPCTIYQVTASFNYSHDDIIESGIVYYAFIINNTDENISISGNGEASQELEEKSNIIVIVTNQSPEVPNVTMNGNINGITIFDDKFLIDNSHKLYYYYISANPGEYMFSVQAENTSINENIQVVADETLWCMFSYWNSELVNEQITYFTQKERILID